jgi:predicted RNA-binding Zn-ribbon protein involved in translation (DUF1610 family)
MVNRKYSQKYTPELLAEAAAASTSIAGALRYLEIPLSGGAHAHISRRLKQFNIDISGEILRRTLIETGVAYRCGKCGLDAMWNGEPLILQVDHINGDYFDNRKENLRFLCPNCHSQTPTFAGRMNGKKYAGP